MTSYVNLSQPFDSTGTITSTGSTASPALDPSVVASFLASLPADLQSIPPSLIGSSTSTFGLTTSVGIVSPGSTVDIDASMRSSLYVGDNSSVNLSSSLKADGTPVHLDVVVGGGSNKVVLNRGPSIVFSTNGNDTITSSGGRDQLYGGFGQDSLVGGGRSVVVGGLSGNDTLVGGLNRAAQDTIASLGSSHINTALGHNLILAAASDTVNAGQSSDTIYAGDGAATIRGGSGALVYGSGRSSLVVGGGKNNTVTLTGSDTLTAHRGSTVVNIDDGSQASIHGGAGHLDVNFAGGSGNDTLFGGTGGLTIHISAGAGAIVNDTNTLDASGYHVVQFASGQTLHVSNVTIDFGNGQPKNV